MTKPPEPVTLFLSYAHEDEALLQQLIVHLSGLQRQGLIKPWHNRQIFAGTKWTQAIDTHLEQASVILLLVSPDFLASDYCYEIEMKRAFQRHAASEARIIPVILRRCDWSHTLFAQLQVLPQDGKPITEWENRDTAWHNVATGIRRVIEDLSLLERSASRAALSPIWNIPFPQNSFFIGRDELLARLHTQLQAGHTTALSQPQAVSGLGGIGKTHIAVEYAYRYHQEYEVVLWARAENEETLISSYSTIAKLLNLPEQDAQEQKVTIQAVKTWLQTHGNWLLILDNADDLDLLPPFLPPVMGGHLLLTTRAWAMQRLAQRIEVETLPKEQGALFLLRRAGLLAINAPLENALPEERTRAMQLVQEMGGLPLALDQAGAYLDATGMSLEKYQHVYQTHRRALLQKHTSLISDHPASVATTWSISFEKVGEKNPSAADLLRLCAYLSADAIPEEILTKGAPHFDPPLKSMVVDPFLLSEAIEVLRAYSLLSRDPRTHTLSVHRLVQAVLRDQIDAEAEKRWKQWAVMAVYEARPDVQDVREWDACERWVPHAQVCAAWIEQEQMMSLEAALLLNAAGYYLDDRARYAEAEPLYERALAIREQQLGGEHPSTATSLNNLALLYYNQGKYAEAEPLLVRALAIQEQQLGSEHPDTATSLNNLALLYKNQEKYAETEPLYKRALAIREQQLGAEHPDTANSLNNLAGLYENQGKYAEAEPLYKRALAIREQQLGAEHPSTATSLNNLASLYENQGKYAEAEPLYERALAIKERQLGAEHPSTATSLNNLASLYKNQGKYAEAEPLYERALAIYERLLGREHPWTQIARGNYANLLRNMGRDEDARKVEGS